MIDTHEYVTRLANLQSTYVISFDIPNPEEDLEKFSVVRYLLNVYYRADPDAITLINELRLTERNGHQISCHKHNKKGYESMDFLEKMVNYTNKYKNDKVIEKEDWWLTECETIPEDSRQNLIIDKRSTKLADLVKQNRDQSTLKFDIW